MASSLSEDSPLATLFIPSAEDFSSDVTSSTTITSRVFSSPSPSTGVPIKPTSSSLSLPTSSSSTQFLTASSTAFPHKISPLQPVEIAAIAAVGCVMFIGFVAVFFLFWIPGRTRRHNQIYIHPDEKGGGAAHSLAHSSLSSVTVMKDLGYFPDRRSFSDWKGMTPLLNHSQLRNPGSLSVEESVRSSSYENRTLAEEPLSPLLVRFPEQTDMQNAQPLPKTLQDRPRRLPPLTIPIYGPSTVGVILRSHSRSPPIPESYSPVSSTTESFADTEDSPSIYSQPSAYPVHLYSPSLNRGPSLASRAGGRIPSTIAESPYTVYHHRASSETLTEITDNGTLPDRTLERPLAHVPPLPPLPTFLEEHPHFPIVGGLDIFDIHAISNQETPRPPSNNRLVRQNTAVIASLLKSRQRNQAERSLTAWASASSDISHIERSGSIKPAKTSKRLKDVRKDGHEVKVAADREPYGRRFRKMKAERDMKEQLSNLTQDTRT